MQNLLEWTLETIRSDEAFEWLEEYRFDWTPAIYTAIEKILRGEAVLLLSDKRRVWLVEYILLLLNDPKKKRPLLPIYRLESFLPSTDILSSTEEFGLVEDMLSISFPNGYFIWYIGEESGEFEETLYSREDNLIWILGENRRGGFALPCDEQTDIKLIQLCRIFEKSIDVSMFGEI